MPRCRHSTLSPSPLPTIVAQVRCGRPSRTRTARPAPIRSDSSFRSAQTINLATPLLAVTDPVTVLLDATQKPVVTLPQASPWVNNSSLTVTGAGSLTFIGGIEGNGNLTIDEDSSLTASHLIQDALVIGGTASSHGLVTIGPADAAGNPLATTRASDNAVTTTVSEPRLAARTAFVASAITAASDANFVTATAIVLAAPILQVADASGSGGSSYSSATANTNPSDSADLMGRRPTIRAVDALIVKDFASKNARWPSSLVAAVVSSQADLRSSDNRKLSSLANRSGCLLNPDAVAAVFGDADALTWAATSASRRSGADSDADPEADDLLTAVGQQWQKTSWHTAN